MAAGLREFPGAGGFEKHSIARTPAQGQPGADTKKAKAPAPGLAGRDYKAPVPSAGRRSPPLCSLQGILSGLQGHACLLFPRPVWAGKGPDAPADSPPLPPDSNKAARGPFVHSACWAPKAKGEGAQAASSEGIWETSRPLAWYRDWRPPDSSRSCRSRLPTEARALASEGEQMA